MSESNQTVSDVNTASDVNLDTEEDESEIAAKITSEIQQSRAHWQGFKDLCTELYFDFLSYKENITDDTKSNTFIPLSYVDIMVNKARIKKVINSSRPIARVKPQPFDPDLSLRLSIFADSLLEEANWEKFLDILVQDACIYPGSIFQVSYGVEHKNLPAFWDAESLGQALGIDLTGVPIRIPKFDENGERVFEMQETREGIFLENIPIQDFYLPKNSREAETDPWAAKTYNKGISWIENAREPNGEPTYHNMDKLRALGTTRRADTSESTRMKEPVKRDYPSASTYEMTFDIIEFCTDSWIFHIPEGADFLIKKVKNPYRRKPYHIARVELLNGEPYGFCPNRANHLMTRTFNEVVDIIMDGLFLEDNKAWVLNDDLVDDFEVGATQGNLIHVTGLDNGVDVRTAIHAIETRAITTEVFPLLEKLDQIHQLTGARSNPSAGMAAPGAETAYENAVMAEGGSHRILDMASNLVVTALRPIYEDMFHLLKINFATEKSIQTLDDNGKIIHDLTVTSGDVYGDPQFIFEFLGKERKRIDEQAAVINLLQVWGNMTNIDPVSVLLMRSLLINSGISDVLAIQEALDQSIQQRQMMQQMQLAMQSAQGKQVGDKQGMAHQAMNRSANASSAFKMPGI